MLQYIVIGGIVRFLITFFFIYGAMHVYAYLRLKSLMPQGPIGRLIIVFFSIMMLMPMLVRIAERRDHERLASLFAWSGYCWMGFLFIFVVILGCLDICRYSLLRAVPPDPALGASIALLLAFGCSIYGFFEAKNIRTEHITIKSPKIGASTGKIRLVQLSDVHLGAIIGEKRLKSMLDAVSAAKPDIIVVTGDLIDGQVHRLNGMSEQLKAIAPRYGKFAVIGNHEYYAGLRQSLDFMQRSGITVLRKEKVSFAGSILIAGVDDTAGARWGDTAASGEEGLFVPSDRDNFTILLKHRPVATPESRGLVDLQLSGHVHKGQIFPFNLITWFFFPVRAGLNQLSEGSMLYVNRGTGTWGPPIRFFAPPEVTVIDILPGRVLVNSTEKAS